MIDVGWLLPGFAYATGCLAAAGAVVALGALVGHIETGVRASRQRSAPSAVVRQVAVADYRKRCGWCGAPGCTDSTHAFLAGHLPDAPERPASKADPECPACSGLGFYWADARRRELCPCTDARLPPNARKYRARWLDKQTTRGGLR